MEVWCSQFAFGHLTPIPPESFIWWEKIGKDVNHAKLAVPNHSEPLQWEKIGKVANQVKVAAPSHSEPVQWDHLVVWCLQFAFGHLPTHPLPPAPSNYHDLTKIFWTRV